MQARESQPTSGLKATALPELPSQMERGVTLRVDDRSVSFPNGRGRVHESQPPMTLGLLPAAVCAAETGGVDGWLLDAMRLELLLRGCKKQTAKMLGLAFVLACRQCLRQTDTDAELNPPIAETERSGRSEAEKKLNVNIGRRSVSAEPNDHWPGSCT
jgi:hypothetical protein